MKKLEPNNFLLERGDPKDIETHSIRKGAELFINMILQSVSKSSKQFTKGSGIFFGISYIPQGISFINTSYNSPFVFLHLYLEIEVDSKNYTDVDYH